jgi:error-prone DNA polymerase
MRPRGLSAIIRPSLPVPCLTPNLWDYAPATIVEDAKRHNLVVRPIAVSVSDWDCTLEPCDQSAGGFAVRMGLRYVKGFREKDWERIYKARRQAPFATLEDFVRRSGLDEGVLSTLAECGAFEGFGLDRRTALWDMRRLSRTRYESILFTTASDYLILIP